MSVDLRSIIGATAAAGGLWASSKVVQQYRKRSKLPPGPPSLPFIGSVLSFPKEQKWLTFTKWAEEYGDITYVNLLGSDVLIINSRAALSAFFESRSANYSDRPSLYFACELVGWKDLPVLMPIGPEHTGHRRLMAKTIGTKTLIGNMQGMVEAQVHRFMRRAVQEPGKLGRHIRTMSAAIILAITYGYMAKDSSDKLVNHAEKVAADISLALASGSHLVDFIPAFKYLPSWFPGGGFKNTAAAMRKDRDQFMNDPFEFVLKELADGTVQPSFVQQHLDGQDLTPEQEQAIKWAATMLYLGGTDSSISAVHTFILCMLLNPAAQKKAQAELDAVLGLGPERLPTAADRARLPYTEACWKESLRWHTIAPEGLAHMVRDDDVYEGYHIPKGTFVMPNIWLFAHDPQTYSDPDSFRPERYLGDKPELDPTEYVFSVGRRSCPGQLLAENTIWTVATNMLALLDIRKAKGPDGKELGVDVEYYGGATTFPKEFPVDIVPRSERAAAILAEVSADL